MTVYPNTETYLINWPAGASGSFLASLVAHFVNEDFHSSLSANGNSHDGKNVIAENWKLDPENFTKIYTVEPTHLHIEPRYEDRPFILFDHVLPDWELLFAQFPKFKNIRVTISPNEVIRMFANLFFKQFVEHYSLGNPTHNYWVQTQGYYPYLKKYNSPKDVDLETVRRYLEDSSTYDIPDCWRDECELPDQYKDKIYLIRFYDIIHNRDLVLEKISQITSRPITDKVLEFYNDYIEKQDELVKSKMPWLNDK